MFRLNKVSVSTVDNANVFVCLLCSSFGCITKHLMSVASLVNCHTNMGQKIVWGGNYNLTLVLDKEIYSSTQFFLIISLSPIKSH